MVVGENVEWGHAGWGLAGGGAAMTRVDRVGIVGLTHGSEIQDGVTC